MAAGTEAAGGRVLPGLRWSAVIAGVFLAIAAQIVLGLVGGALGFAAEPADSARLGAGAAIWSLVAAFVATLLGAWLAVRMAGAERDRAASTLHGVMVWCIGLIAGAIFITGTIASGAMATGTATRTAPIQRMFGGEAGRAAARADRAAAALGSAALASIAGLLGAVSGVALARGRSTGRRFGWRLAIQRREERGEARFPTTRREEEREYAPPYGEPRPGAPGEPRHDVGRPPTDPHHH